MAGREESLEFYRKISGGALIKQGTRWRGAGGGRARLNVPANEKNSFQTRPSDMRAGLSTLRKSNAGLARTDTPSRWRVRWRLTCAFDACAMAFPVLPQFLNT